MGSFFVHVLLLYGLVRPGGSTQTSTPPQNSVIQVQLVPGLPLPQAVLDVPLPQKNAPTATEQPAQPLNDVALKKSASPVQSQTGFLSPTSASPKVKKFPDLAYPPDTVNISATLEIEVSLDKDGKATDVKVLSESPKSLFTEWAWELGMQGEYSPKVTPAGPVPSTLRIRLDITPGMPVEVR